MKKLLKNFDFKKTWVFLFLLFFLSVPHLLEEPLSYTVVFFGICIFVTYKYDIPKFSLLLFLIALIARVVIVLTIKTPAVSDFGVLFNASQSLIEGDLSFQETNYFQLWSYQIGFVFFQSLLLRIWNNILILKLFNCILGAATVALVYLIAKEFVSKKAAQCISLIYCFFPFSLFYVTILSNQFLASFLIYAGLYLVVSNRFKLKSYYKYLIFAVILAFANVIRPESIIPLLATVIFLVLTINKSNIKERLLNIAILVVTYYALTYLISQLFVITGLSPNGLSNNAPHWKFVLGFNHETGGKYTDGDAHYLLDADAAWSAVKDRICVPVSELLDLFKSKINTFWTGSHVNWTFNYCMDSGITVLGTTFRISDDVPLLNGIARWIMFLFYLLLAVGVFRYIRKKNWDSKILLFVNQVFVTYGVYLLIEVQPRYAYHIQISVAILAALGVCSLQNFIKNRKNTNEKGR